MRFAKNFHDFKFLADGSHAFLRALFRLQYEAKSKSHPQIFNIYTRKQTFFERGFMLNRLMGFMLEIRDRQRIGIAVGKGAAMMQSRVIDLKIPTTWEFSGFSQNGEDGVLHVLRHKLKKSNRYFIEIGAADGVENNTAWLLVAEKYNGLMFEGDPRLVARARRSVICYSIGAECHSLFVTLENVKEIGRLAMHLDPDVFSLDIDGNDFHIAKALFEIGFRPKIFVVEYNSVYGPHRSVTTHYKQEFRLSEAHSTQLHYGVSISGWRKFFDELGYQFVTVEQNGVNAFFVDPQHFDEKFLGQIEGVDYAENQYQYRKFRMPSDRQFELIADEALLEI